MFIYLITNLINDKQYIGRTIRQGKRFDEYWGSGKHIQSSVLKYGVENFTKEILQICFNNQELIEAEIYWIAKLKTKTPFGYNIHDGGQGGDSLSMKSAEEKAEIYKKKREKDPTLYKRIWQKRRESGPIEYTDEQREVYRQNLIKNFHSPEVRKRVVEFQKNKKPAELKYTFQNLMTNEIVELTNIRDVKEYFNDYNQVMQYPSNKRSSWAKLFYDGFCQDFVFLKKESVHYPKGI